PHVTTTTRVKDALTVAIHPQAGFAELVHQLRIESPRPGRLEAQQVVSVSARCLHEIVDPGLRLPVSSRCPGVAASVRGCVVFPRNPALESRQIDLEHREVANVSDVSREPCGHIDATVV